MPLEEQPATKSGPKSGNKASSSTEGESVLANRGSAHDLFGEGGVGPLLSRARSEVQFLKLRSQAQRALSLKHLSQAQCEDGLKRFSKELLKYPLTRDELIRLIDHYKDEALPEAVRTVLIEELREERKNKSGPKHVRLQSSVDKLLLAHEYARGLARGEKIRVWRKARKASYGGRFVYHTPTAREYACRYIRRRFPEYRDLTDAAISNMLSLMRRGTDWLPKL